eukprot:scaffold269536_cov36-Tisochrysis_lutea.AAC.1
MATASQKITLRIDGASPRETHEVRPGGPYSVHPVPPRGRAASGGHSQRATLITSHASQSARHQRDAGKASCLLSSADRVR